MPLRISYQSMPGHFISLKMLITRTDPDGCHIRIHRQKQTAWIYYTLSNRKIEFRSEGELTKLLKANINQLKSILCHKKTETFYQGFKLHFVLQQDRSQALNHDPSRITAIDRRRKDVQIYFKKAPSPGIAEIITDGSYNPHKAAGGYSIIHREPGKTSRVTALPIRHQSSNLIEMQAVIEGLRCTPKKKPIRLVTDSQYVIKGISRWIYHWKINNWKTANAEGVKNKKQWKQLDRLLNGRYVELQWVRAHQDHPENNLCDHLARQAARDSTKDNHPLKRGFHKTKVNVYGIFSTINQRSSIRKMREHVQKPVNRIS